jgi:ribosomal protein S20/uncharacterized protein YukE
MNKVDGAVRDLDKHFAGKVMARKAQKAQDGPFRKVLTKLRTDTKMVRNALEANKTKKNEAEVKACQSMIDDMFSEGSEVWDTHAGIMDEKKTDAYAKAALKEWNGAVKKAKDKMVKKILSKSKTPKLLADLSKTLAGVGAAQRAFMGHNGKFNQAHARLQQSLGTMAAETKKVAAALQQTKAAAEKMDRVAM